MGETDKMVHAPLELLIAVHYYYSNGEKYVGYNTEHDNSEAVRLIKARMVEAGLLCEVSHPGPTADYERTDALVVWIEAMCSVPFPIQKWVIPEKEHGDG